MSTDLDGKAAPRKDDEDSGSTRRSDKSAADAAGGKERSSDSGGDKRPKGQPVTTVRRPHSSRTAGRTAPRSGAGHATDPPPVIPPKSKPAKAPGAVKAVKTVGGGSAGAGSGTGEAGTKGPARRSFRTAQPARVPTLGEGAGAERAQGSEGTASAAKPVGKVIVPKTEPSGAKAAGDGKSRTSSEDKTRGSGDTKGRAAGDEPTRATEGEPTRSTAKAGGRTTKVRAKGAAASAPTVVGGGAAETAVSPAAVAGQPAEGRSVGLAGKRGKKEAASGVVTSVARGDEGGERRRIRLSLTRVSPMSVAKVSFLVSIAAGIAFCVMVFVLWTILDDKQVFTKIDDMVNQLTGGQTTEKFDVLQVLRLGKIMSGAMIIAVVDVVLATVLATLGAVVYNLIASLVGGVHVTLTDD